MSDSWNIEMIFQQPMPLPDFDCSLGLSLNTTSSVEDLPDVALAKLGKNSWVLMYSCERY